MCGLCASSVTRAQENNGESNKNSIFDMMHSKLH